MSNSVQSHRWKPTGLPRPWDSPGKIGSGLPFPSPLPGYQIHFSFSLKSYKYAKICLFYYFEYIVLSQSGSFTIWIQIFNLGEIDLNYIISCSFFFIFFFLLELYESLESISSILFYLFISILFFLLFLYLSSIYLLFSAVFYLLCFLFCLCFCNGFVIFFFHFIHELIFSLFLSSYDFFLKLLNISLQSFLIKVLLDCAI